MLTPDIAVDEIIPTIAAKDGFFHGGHWGQCLELVSHLCQYGDSIIQVSGPQGIGKTTLKQALLNNSADRFHFCRVQANADLTNEDLRTKLADDFDPEIINSERMVDRGLVLLIDDAEKLELSVMSTILQLRSTTGLHDRLHIVLFADTQLDSIIARSPLKDKFAELVHTIELETLTASEVEAFLNHLWSEQGHNSELPLDKAALKKIYATSNGIPGKVQEIAQSLLIGTDVKKINLSSKRLSPFSVGLTVSFGLLFCVLAFLWPSAEPQLNTATEIQSIPDISADLQPEFGAAETVISSSAPLDINAAAISAQETNATVDGLLDQAQGMQQDTTTAPVLGIQPQAAATVLPETTDQQPHEYETYADKISRLENKLAALQQQVEHEQDARHVAENKMHEILSANRAATKNPVSHKKQVTKVKAKVKTSKKNRDEDFLLNLSSRSYTLQLVAASKEHKVQDFIRHNKLADNARVFRSNYKGKPWFIVVYGNYSTRAEAVAALSQLPYEVKQAKPWAREMSTVQNTIKKQ